MADSERWIEEKQLPKPCCNAWIFPKKQKRDAIRYCTCKESSPTSKAESLASSSQSSNPRGE